MQGRRRGRPAGEVVEQHPRCCLDRAGSAWLRAQRLTSVAMQAARTLARVAPAAGPPTSVSARRAAPHAHSDDATRQPDQLIEDCRCLPRTVGTGTRTRLGLGHCLLLAHRQTHLHSVCPTATPAPSATHRYAECLGEVMRKIDSFSAWE